MNTAGELHSTSRNDSQEIQESSSLILITGESDNGRMSTATYCLEVCGSGQTSVYHSKGNPTYLQTLLMPKPTSPLIKEGHQALHPRPSPRIELCKENNRAEKVNDVTATTDASSQLVKEHTKLINISRQNLSQNKAICATPKHGANRLFVKGSKQKNSVPLKSRGGRLGGFSKSFNPRSTIALSSCSTPSSNTVLFKPRVFSLVDTKLRASHYCGENFDDNIIEESAEESTLHEYWLKKEDIEEKYAKLLANLDAEEKAEITHYAIKARFNAKAGEGILHIKDEYDRTRDLILKLKLMELEEILDGYKTRLLEGNN